MKKLVVIPTYNEAENVQNLIPAIFHQDIEGLSILVVDDSSPDGTGELVLKLKEKFPNLNLLTRTNKEGLAKAYLAGFQWALDNSFDVITEMDADFSHRPEDLKNILSKVESVDFVVGSRYCDGGGVANWSFLRKFISRGGSFYSKLILQKSLNDWTGGFNAWKADVLRDSIGLSNVQSEGYCFQIELKYRALRAGRKGIEVPILFEDRRAGESKMGMGIVLEALYRVWKIRFI